MAVCKTIFLKKYTVSHCGLVRTDFTATTAGEYTFVWTHLGAIRQETYTASTGEKLPLYGGWFNERANITGTWKDPAGATVTVTEGADTVEELHVTVYQETDASNKVEP